MRTIVCVPHNTLRTPAQAVHRFDRRLARMISEMRATLLATRHPKGVGLAAPQIGEPWRVFITKPNEQSDIRVFINPEIVKRSREQTDGVPERGNKLEGCLSIPNIWGKVKRAKTLTFRYQDEKGNIHVEEFTGFLATIIQHEADHTNGILFTQRVLEQKGKLYQTSKDSDGKEILEGISLP
ncbi:peptide deformylase [Candidatus Gottesmanbacteria bacterium]|nr:peptide deformylase [Candidatus Gottesmanbacteria bacterium]